jgi:hypothetical protein
MQHEKRDSGYSDNAHDGGPQDGATPRRSGLRTLHANKYGAAQSHKARSPCRKKLTMSRVVATKQIFILTRAGVETRAV